MGFKGGLFGYGMCQMCEPSRVLHVGHFLCPVCLSQFDIKGRNFLHIAIQKSDLESVLFLLSVCVSVNSRVHDSTQMTPLHLAVISGNEMIVRNLVLEIFGFN